MTSNHPQQQPKEAPLAMMGDETIFWPGAMKQKRNDRDRRRQKRTRGKYNQVENALELLRRDLLDAYKKRSKCRRAQRLQQHRRERHDDFFPAHQLAANHGIQIISSRSSQEQQEEKEDEWMQQEDMIMMEHKDETGTMQNQENMFWVQSGLHQDEDEKEDDSPVFFMTEQELLELMYEVEQDLVQLQEEALYDQLDEYEQEFQDAIIQHDCYEHAHCPQQVLCGDNHCSGNIQEPVICPLCQNSNLIVAQHQQHHLNGDFNISCPQCPLNLYWQTDEHTGGVASANRGVLDSFRRRLQTVYTQHSGSGTCHGNLSFEMKNNQLEATCHECSFCLCV